MIGRWTTIDPLVEFGQESTSPYGYVFDDPVKNTDPDGRMPDEDPPGKLSMAGNFVKGVGQSLWGTVTGTVNTILHPINTIAAIHNLSTPQGTVDLSMSAFGVIDKFNNGNGDVKANMLGQAAGDVAQLFVGVEEIKIASEALKGVRPAGEVAKVVDDVADATGFGPKTTPMRFEGPWTKNDLTRASEGKGPLDFVPTSNKAGRQMPLELHHGDQMPGSAIHEVKPAHTKYVPHPNKFNQGVTPAMRIKDSQMHWYMRGLEMGN